MSIVWFRGDLWPYESMTSIGATFVVSNSCTPRSFCEWLRKFSDEKPAVAKTLRTEGATFHHSQLLEVLDDNPDITERKIAWKRTLNAQALTCSLGILEPNFSILRTCPQCCGIRYHSVLHQLPWLQRCFIHDTPLLATRGSNAAGVIKAGAVGVRHIEALLKIWFPDGANLHRGRVKGDRPAIVVPKALRAVVASLNSMEKDVKLSGDLQLAVHCASPSKAIAISVLATGRKLPRSSRAILLASGEEAHHETFAATEDQVHRMMSLSCEEFDDMVEARLGHVYVHKLQVPWMLALQETFRIMKQGHEPCRAALESLGPTFSDEGPRLHRYASEYTRACDVAQRLGKRGIYLCRRPISIQTLAEVTDCSKRLRNIVRSYRRIGLLPRMFPNFDSLNGCGLVKVACIAPRKPMMNYFSAADCDWIIPALLSERDAYDAVVPAGPLAQVADALLLVRLWRWVWTLNKNERHLEVTNDQSHAATSAAALGQLDMAHRFALSPTADGLKLTVLASGPLRQPDWLSSRSELESHRRIVEKLLQVMKATV